MRVSSACFQDWSDNERFFQTPEDSFSFKLSGLSKGIVFVLGIFPPQYSPSSSFSFGTVRLRRMTLLLQQENLDVLINGQVIREPQTIVRHEAKELRADVVVTQSRDQMEHPPFIIPIVFKDQYYGNLMLWHKDTSHFHDTDKLFFEWLAQQLASTIYRLETVQARQEAEEMSSIGQIAFALTHRLDNALGLVETYVNTIRRVLVTQDGTNEVISEKLGNIQRAARTVLDLSEALKDALARSGEVLASESLSIPPKALLEEIRGALVLPGNIQVHLEVDEEVASIRAIPSLVNDILHNLITNAVQAMPKGGKITLKARNMDVGNTVALEITDTGVGIPQERLPKIFGLFYSTRGSYGFGLWNARRNALKNGGDLKVVESQPGQGTTFRLLVPRVE